MLSQSELFDIITTRPGRSVSPTEFQLMDYMARMQRRYVNTQLLREDDNPPMTVGDYSRDVLKKPYIVKPQ